MAINLDEYVQKSEKPGKTKEDLCNLLGVVSQALGEGGDTKKLLHILFNVVSAFGVIDDEQLTDEILRLNHELYSLIRSDSERSISDYVFMLVYLKLAFSPKIIEHGLKIVRNDASISLHKFVAYSELTTESLNCGLYEKAREYAYRVIECIDFGNEAMQNLYRLNAYCNLLIVLANMNRPEEFARAREMADEILRNNSDNPAILGLGSSLAADLVGAEIKAQGLTKERLDDYFYHLTSLTAHEDSHNTYFHKITEDVPVLNKIFDAGYYWECADICRMLLNHPVCFIGDMVPVFHIVEKLNDVDRNLFDEDEYAGYMKKYLECLKKSCDNSRSMLQHLACEEFKIDEINHAYDMMKAKYETDPLTVCYNRPSFEMNAAVFLGDHPEGSVVFVDLDGLKNVNDKFGHSAGDFMLKTFVQMFNASINKELERLYRYAGDEFILITARKKEETEELMAQILNKFERPFIFNEDNIPIFFSYGVAAFSEGQNERDVSSVISAVVKIADGRMYECKHKHKEINPESVRR